MPDVQKIDPFVMRRHGYGNNRSRTPQNPAEKVQFVASAIKDIVKGDALYENHMYGRGEQDTVIGHICKGHIQNSRSTVIATQSWKKDNPGQFIETLKNNRNNGYTARALEKQQALGREIQGLFSHTYNLGNNIDSLGDAKQQITYTKNFPLDAKIDIYVPLDKYTVDPIASAAGRRLKGAHINLGAVGEGANRRYQIFSVSPDFTE